MDIMARGLAVGSGRTVDFIVAASDAPDYIKRYAHYICGGVNDEVEINAAINALQEVTSTSGYTTKVGHVQLSSGVFNLGASITIASNGVELSGAGQAVSVQKGATILHAADGSNLSAVIEVTGNNAILHDFFVDGNKTGNPDGYDGISINSNSCSLTRIAVENCKRTGYLINGSSNEFQQINSGKNGGNGYKIIGAYGTYTMINSEYNGNVGIDIYGNRNRLFAASSWEDTLGFDLEGGAYGNIFTGCTVDSSRRHGFEIDGSHHNIFQGFMMTNCGTEANNTYSAFYLVAEGARNCTNNIFNGCMISSTNTNKPKYGIYEDDASQDYNTYTNNQVLDCCHTAAILIKGANSTNSSNIILNYPFTFTRSSIAYKQDGTLDDLNEPRYEAARFGPGIMLEEGTSNLLTANQSSVETDIGIWVDLLA